MALDAFLTGSYPKEEIIRQAIEDILPEEDYFITISGKKPFSADYSLKVATIERSDMSHSLVELAFQYIAKVLTACYCNDENVNPIENSPAHKSISNLKWRLSSEYYGELKQRFDYAEMRILEYIDNGSDSTQNIIQHCWFLAKLDVCYRKGAVPSDVAQFFIPAGEDEVREIKGLAVLFKRNFLPDVLTSTSKIIFNPHFGFGESLMGESNCHMIIDRTIIDLRADFSYEYPAYRIAKSLGYYMMTLINQEFDQRECDWEIDNLVFYSGRYGETEILSVDEIGQDNINRTLDKIILATEAKYKYKSSGEFKKNNREHSPVPQNHNRSRGEVFLEQYGREEKDYNDGYNQVVHKKHHIFRNIMIFIIIVSLLIVAFGYIKDWYVGNFGEDFMIDHIIKNIFG